MGENADANVLRPRVYFDVAINDSRGRIVMELFSDICPKTCENFRVLSIGGFKRESNKPTTYKDTNFHRVIKDFMIQGGDVENCDGRGGYSIYGDCFDDENFQLKHDKPFLLSMANKGPHTNASQFFITTNLAPHLDNVHVVFGHVLKGKEVVMLIENQEVDPESFKPLANIKIVNSGELIKVSTALNIAKNKLSEQPATQESSDVEISSGSSADEAESDDDAGGASAFKELTASEKASLAERIYKEKLKIIAKKMNVPMEAMGLLPLDINEIPKIPKNPLQRDVSYHRTFNRKLYEDSGCTVEQNGRIIKGRGKMDYKPEDKQIQIKHKLKSSKRVSPSFSRGGNEPGPKHSPSRRIQKISVRRRSLSSEDSEKYLGRRSSSSITPRRKLVRQRTLSSSSSPNDSTRKKNSNKRRRRGTKRQRSRSLEKLGKRYERSRSSSSDISRKHQNSSSDEGRRRLNHSKSNRSRSYSTDYSSSTSK